MNLKLHSSFLGSPLYGSFSGRNSGNCVFVYRGNHARRVFRKRVYSEKRNDWVAQVVKFTKFFGKHVELLRKSIRGRNRLEVKCLKEPFVQSKALLRSLGPVWEEGLLFVRCSVFFSVLAGICLLVWYGQNKACGFVETRLLPSVCSMLSENIQRELDFGKVRRVSPLCITLEACSIGPHSEEFSCGEVPTMKLWIRPFASLRRGKVVVDAVLNNPIVLVAQKKDFTWLGIPLSEGGLQRHLSSEEGIDFRTKTRRIAREEAGIRWANDRDNAAIKAAEMGYIVSERSSSQSEDDALKQDRHFSELVNSKSLIYMDEKMHSTDHHCMDTGLDYDMKHAELERSFGIKIPGSGLKFWTKAVKAPGKNKVKWNSKANKISASGVSAKRRILERSASAALSYFEVLSQQKPDEPSTSLENYDQLGVDMLLMSREKENNNQHDGYVPSDERLPGYDWDGKDHQPSGRSLLTKDPTCLDKLILLRDPFLSTIDRLCVLINRGENFPCAEDDMKATAALSFSSQGEDITADIANKSAEDVTHGGESQKLTFKRLEDQPEVHHGVPSPQNSKVTNSSKKLKSGVDPRVEDTATICADKTLPVMLDSVHFRGGTLMLLAYGDREPREMRNAHGHVKFQNHYGRLYVQLSGNCNMWRSDEISEDGGFLSTDVFVDTVEQNWHANLKVANFFVPLFERILEIPIEWSMGRATGEVLF